MASNRFLITFTDTTGVQRAVIRVSRFDGIEGSAAVWRRFRRQAMVRLSSGRRVKPNRGLLTTVKPIGG